METAIATFIAIICGGLLNMAAAVWAEHRRRARLKLSIETPLPDIPLQVVSPTGRFAGVFRVVRVHVSNDPQGFFDRWMRSPALQCRAIISFHNISDGKEIFGRAMQGRWSRALQPTPIPVVDGNGNIVLHVLDPEKMGIDSRIDIYPGDS